MSDVDYWSVDVPDESEKPREEFHYTERRAELLRLVIRNGSPYNLNQTALGDRYGVDRSTISRDLDAINDSVEKALGNRAAVTARATVESVVDALDEAVEEGEWRAAEAKFRVIMDWNEYLADRGAIERAPDQHEVDVTTREAGDETDDYVVVPDDEVDALLADAEEVEALENGDGE